MRTHLLEATNGPLNWGKFMVGRWTDEEWAVRSVVAEGHGLVAGRGWGPTHFMMFDLQTGEGAMFHPGGLASADLAKHQIWVCPLFEPTLTWIYQASAADPDWFDQLPAHVEHDHPFEWAGYRRSGAR